MQLLNLKDQQDIVKVIEYLVEIHQKNNTVDDVMKTFGLSVDEYRMCCNLAMPALRQGNMKGRYTALRQTNRKIRKDIKALYELAQWDNGPLAMGVKALYDDYVERRSRAVFASAEGQEIIDVDANDSADVAADSE